jgi:hypothetical protein
MVAAVRALVRDPLPGAGCDLDEARRFLKRLDPNATEFTFATFTDAKDKPRPDPLAEIRTGTFDELAPWLVRKNEMGAGVFVTVNETDGTGRKKENIVRIRALWQEADRGDEPELPVEPHMVVESSPGKFHRYVLVRDGVLEEFEVVQKRLVDDFGSDPNAKDRSRVLRLPGFYHMKKPQTPHLVRLIEVSEEPPLFWGDAKGYFPPVETRTRVVRDGDFGRPELATGGVDVDEAGAGTQLLNPAEIASALDYLDPDMPYEDWLKVGMALHSTGGSALALELWDQWSAKGHLYHDGEPAYRWGTFSAEREDAVTIGTLFWMAKQAGWTGGYGNSDFVRHFVPIEREQKLVEFNRWHGMALIEGKDVIVYRERDASIGCLVTRLADLKSIRNFYLDRQVPVAEQQRNGWAVRNKSLVDLWLQWSRRRKYRQVVLLPEGGLVAGELSLPDGDVLNLYLGLAVQPKQGDCSRMLAHIREVICNGNQELYEYVMNWLARLFQHPDKPGETALVLQSGQGTGKNIVIDPLVRAFGGHGMVFTRAEDLTGRFNDHLGTSVLVFLNEALWGGDKSQEGTLKALITDEGIFTERKRIDKRRVRNHNHLIVASNNEWAVPIDLDDRRFVVLEVSEARKGDHAYFQALAEEVQNGGTEALIHHLLHLDISGFNPRELPKTGSQQAKLLAKIRGLDSVSQWWVDCLESGQIMADFGHGVTSAISGADTWEEGPITVPKDALYRSYVDSMASSRRHVFSKSEFGKKLPKLIGDGFRSVKMASASSRRSEALPLGGLPAAGKHEKRVNGYRIPGLTECREAFDKLMGQPGTWDEAEDVAESGESP